MSTRSLVRAAFAVAIAASALVPLRAARAASAAVRDFQKQWAEAGQDEEKKRAALDALFAGDKSEEAAKLFLAVAANEQEEATVVDAALRHLAGLEGQPGDAFLLHTLEKSTRWTDRALVVRALSFRETDATIAPLSAALKDRQWQVVAAAIEGIARHRVKEAIEPLIAGMERLDAKDDASRRLAGDYRDALERLTGEKLSTAQDWRNWWSAHAKDFKIAGGAVEARRKSGEHVTEERAPRLFDEVRSRRVVFILDISGSMTIPTGALKSTAAPQGITRFEAMRREARRVVEELPTGTKFNLIAFSSDVLPWSPKLQVASDAKKKEAQKFIDRLEAKGETNSYGALEAAFRDREVDTIYFLSDGYPTAGKVTEFTRICAEVGKWNATRNVRIHTIAFLAGDGKPLGIIEGDKSVPKAFMETLAEENGGVYRLVE
jgi:hypothetical protein